MKRAVGGIGTHLAVAQEEHLQDQHISGQKWPSAISNQTIYICVMERERDLRILRISRSMAGGLEGRGQAQEVGDGDSQGGGGWLAQA